MDLATIEREPTFAIIGGKAPEIFKMRESAAGFAILSDTLYKHKKLACVREVLCNAWDAHIEAGVTRPVEITLTESSMTIRDFGRGIPLEKMIEVYGTYFGSTKQSDDRQTGGFGLGSKAPWAYTDHFIVTTHHNGVRATYAAHKGSDDTNGVPALVPMNSGPTTDTGLMVQVPLITPTDAGEFRTLLTRLVKGAGVPVLLNNQLMEAPDLTALKENGYGVTPTGFATSPGLHVLYGNVVYPIDHISELRELIRGLKTYASEMLFYAEPGTLHVVPSREGLSYGTTTIATLTELISSATAEIKACLSRAEEDFLNRRWENMQAQLTRFKLDDFWRKAPSWGSANLAESEILTSSEEIAEKYIERKFIAGTLSPRKTRSLFLRKTRDNRRSLARALPRKGLPSLLSHIPAQLSRERHSLFQRKIARRSQDRRSEIHVSALLQRLDLLSKLCAQPACRLQQDARRFMARGLTSSNRLEFEPGAPDRRKFLRSNPQGLRCGQS